MIFRWRTHLVIFLGSLISAAHADSGSGVAIGYVLDVAGQPVLSKGAARQRAEIFDRIEFGHTLTVPTGAKVVFLYRPERVEYTFFGPSRLKFSGSGIERQTGDPGVARALPANMSLRLEANARTQPSLKKPDVGGTQPDNGETLLTNRPTLSWWSEKTHESFELRLIDCGTEIDSCSGSPSRVVLRSRAWRPSAEDALEWGHFYRWSVTPLKNPRAAQGGWFWVISPDHLEVLAALHPGESRETANLVLYAQALEEVGARAEAREIWQQLANLRPEQRGFVCKAAGRPVEQCRRMSQSDGY